MKKCVLCPPVAIPLKRWNNADSSPPAKVETCSHRVASEKEAAVEIAANAPRFGRPADGV